MTPRPGRSPSEVNAPVEGADRAAHSRLLAATPTEAAGAGAPSRRAHHAAEMRARRPPTTAPLDRSATSSAPEPGRQRHSAARPVARPLGQRHRRTPSARIVHEPPVPVAGKTPANATPLRRNLPPALPELRTRRRLVHELLNDNAATARDRR